ncbi:cation transporting ATPase C-terminal domain-containing protein, partial [Patescibacteria group bacterium]|nr:cation transporting ATPase C-terminal domain-containing protein [Patescibacteria group bacterium]
EATKEVADIILRDDNFSTIVNTIREGRRIYHNILAFIKYMLSANFDTIMAVGVLTILGFPLPILPLQILWINIATDSLPALALGASEADKDIMKARPHKKQESIFKKFFDFILIASIFQTITNIAIYFFGRYEDLLLGINLAEYAQSSHARTMVFTEIVIFELLLVFVCKEEKSINLKTFTSNKKLILAVLFSFLLQLCMIYHPFMQEVFKTVSLNATEWLVIIIPATSAFLVPKATKFARSVLKYKHEV